MNDFSVDAQRRMFIEKQALEKQLAQEEKTRMRKRRKQKRQQQHKKQSSSAKTGGEILTANEDYDDDDDSIHHPINDYDEDDNNNNNDDDEYSLDSEESFYVGIERADYTQPDNFVLYGKEEDEQDNNNGISTTRRIHHPQNRLGIMSSHRSIAILHLQGGEENTTSSKLDTTATTTKNDGMLLSLDWDTDILPILHDDEEKGGRHSSLSLYEFMNGSSNNTIRGSGCVSSLQKNGLVALPLMETSSITTTTSSNSGKETNNIVLQPPQVLLDSSSSSSSSSKNNNGTGTKKDNNSNNNNDQVYQHKAAEGKMFIEKILNAPRNSTPNIMTGTKNSHGSSNDVAFPSSSSSSSSPGGGDGNKGTYPTLSPLQLYIPGVCGFATGRRGDDDDARDNTTDVGGGGGGARSEEFNFLRQMRDREVRNEESARIIQGIREIMIASSSTDEGTTIDSLIDANTLMKKLEELRVEE